MTDFEDSNVFFTGEGAQQLLHLDVSGNRDAGPQALIDMTTALHNARKARKSKDEPSRPPTEKSPKSGVTTDAVKPEAANTPLLIVARNCSYPKTSSDPLLAKFLSVHAESVAAKPTTSAKALSKAIADAAHVHVNVIT